MTIGVTNGNSGTNLNFKVLGSSVRPVSARENTIWIKTDTPIRAWSFRPDAPTAPTDGMIWLVTGTSSPVGINALRKNKLMILPTSAKQYVGGDWENMEAHVYIGGTWVQFSFGRTYLYKNGDSCNAITGGWRSDNGSSWLATGTYNINDNGNIYLKGNKSGLWVHTINAVDITAFKTLNAVISYAKGTRLALSVFTPTTEWNMDGDVSRNTISASGTVALDISSLTGQHFIGLGVHSQSVLAEMKVSEVLLR